MPSFYLNFNVLNIVLIYQYTLVYQFTDFGRFLSRYYSMLDKYGTVVDVNNLTIIIAISYI
jgi:hypothetical protein